MIDDITIEISLDLLPEVRQQTNDCFYKWGLIFVPKWNQTGIVKYCSQMENLRLTILNDKLYISNSWHKFYKGNNYSDYTHSDIINTCKLLEDSFGKGFERSKINRIAYGIVINEDAKRNYNNWLNYKSKRPLPMHNSGKIYGAMFDFIDFRIKGYDKTFEVKEHEGIGIGDGYFRIESEIKYMRHLHKRKEPINIFSPKDLFIFENIQLLGNDLMNKYQTIEKNIQIETKGLSMHELNVIASMRDENVRETIKKEHNTTFKRYQREFNKLKQANNSEYLLQVEEKVRNKISDLINS